MSYRIVEQLHTKAIPVERLCRVLGVSRLGYYGFRQRAKVAPKACLIGRHRVRRLMRESKLRTVWRRKFVHTTDSAHSLPVSDNLLARRFNPSEPDQAWVSDITDIRTRQGWLHLGVVLDLYAR